MQIETLSRLSVAILALGAFLLFTGADRPFSPTADAQFVAAPLPDARGRGGRPVVLKAPDAAAQTVVDAEPVLTRRGTRIRSVSPAPGAPTIATVRVPHETARGTRMRPVAIDPPRGSDALAQR